MANIYEVGRNHFPLLGAGHYLISSSLGSPVQWLHHLKERPPPCLYQEERSTEFCSSKGHMCEPTLGREEWWCEGSLSVNHAVGKLWIVG